MVLIKKNESTGTLRRITVILVDQSDGNTLETAQTNLNIEVSKAGAAQASGTGNWGEVGEGEYYYEFGTTEVNTFGKITARFAKTGIREFKAEAQIIGFNPYQTLPTQSSINALNDPTQTEINISVWGKTVRTITATPQTSINEHNQSQTLINQLNDLSTSEVQSIVNAQHNETQSLINNLDVDIQALNDLSVSQVQSIINKHQTDINTKIDTLENESQSTINDFLSTKHGSGSWEGAGSGQTVINKLDAIQSDVNNIQTDINNLNDPTSSAINAVITTAHGAGSYVGGGASQTIINKLDAIQTDVNEIQTDVNNLNDPTPSEINAVITTSHGSGSYVGAGASQTVINKLDAIQTDTNTALPDLINGLNDPTSSAINAVITTAHGAGSYVGGGGQTTYNAVIENQSLINNLDSDIAGLNDISTSEVQSIVNAHQDDVQSIINIHEANIQSMINASGGTSPSSIWNFSSRELTGMTQTDLNEHNATQSMVNTLNDISTTQVQSLINALNDISVAQVQSIVNAEGLEVQSLVNGLNDLSTSQVQSIINAHESNIQSDLNAMNVKLIRIEGRGGLYLVGKYSYNSSDINTKIEFWQYSSQTDMNNHQTINNINKWQGDVTLTGQLASLIKFGDHV